MRPVTSRDNANIYLLATMPNADIWNDGDIFYSILGKSAMKLQNIKIWETMTLAGQFYYEFIPTIEMSAKKPAKAGNVDIATVDTNLKVGNMGL